MPQWRKLHVKTIDSVDINAMPDDFTRLLWLLLPLVLDSKGRAIDNSAWLRSKVFPMREDVTTEQVEQAVTWYAARGMVVRYEVDGRRYFHVPTFEKYQGKTDREAASVIPDPVKQTTRKPRASVTTNSRPTHELVRSKSSSDVEVDAEVEEKTHAGQNQPAPASAPEPDPVKELAAVFEQAAGIKLPTPAGEKGKKQVGVTWWHPLRQMVEIANGQSGALLQAAIAQMRGEKLTIASPSSVLKVFTSLNGERVASAPAPSARRQWTPEEAAAIRADLRAKAQRQVSHADD